MSSPARLVWPAAISIALLSGLAPSARAQSLGWAGDFGLPGANGKVNAAVVHDDGHGAGPTLYIAGSFTSIGDQLAERVARWNGLCFEALGAGVKSDVQPAEVMCLVVYDDGHGPALFAGGNFSAAGGRPANNIARWDGLAWSPVGEGFDGIVRTLTVFDDGRGAGPCLYAGGEVLVGGLSTAQLSRWDGAQWTAVGGNAALSGDAVSALAVHDDGAGDALFVGGSFLFAGDLRVSNIARWDGQSWSALDLGTDGQVRALAVCSERGRRVLVAGGSFERAGDARTSHVARWNGQRWQSLGVGIDGPVFGLGVHGGELYAGGIFAMAGSRPAAGVARWDGASWSNVGTGLNYVAEYVSSFESFDLLGTGSEQLIVCGNLTGAGFVVSQGIVSWDGSEWRAWGTGQGTWTGVNTMSVFDSGSGPTVYIGGELRTAGTAQTGSSGLASWNGRGWTAVPRPQQILGSPIAMAVFDPGTGPGLYVGANDIVAMWNGSSWDPTQELNFHTQGSSKGVRTLLVHDDGTGAALYIGGGFQYSCTSSLSPYLTRWDGSNCSSIGAAGPVNALASFDDGSGPALIAAGTNWSGGSGWVSSWKGGSWTQLGSGFGAVLTAFAVFDDGTGPALYGGGEGLYRWDGTSWTALSSVQGGILDLAVHDDGTGTRPALYATGFFIGVGTQRANSIARWDGTSWTVLGEGLGLTPPWFPFEAYGARTLCSFEESSSHQLWVGGAIQTAGTKPSVGIARWGND